MTTEQEEEPEVPCEFCNERIGEGSINGAWVCGECFRAAMHETFHEMALKHKREYDDKEALK
jgi:hypothetical protein